jgi:hypothetical protein
MAGIEEVLGRRGEHHYRVSVMIRGSDKLKIETCGVYISTIFQAVNLSSGGNCSGKPLT